MRTIAERNALVLAHQKLVSRICYKMRNNPYVRKIGYQEAVAAGQLGLISAAADWDESKGAFSTIAWFRIMHEIQHAARQAFAVTLPLTIVRQQRLCDFRVTAIGERRHSLGGKSGKCPVETAEEESIAQDLMQQLRDRPKGEKRYQILTLWANGESVERIARRFGVSRNAIQVQIKYGLETMRELAGVA